MIVRDEKSEILNHNICFGNIIFRMFRAMFLPGGQEYRAMRTWRAAMRLFGYSHIFVYAGEGLPVCGFQQIAG